METITPEIVRNYKTFTPKFLCDLKDNIYNIKFKKFRVRDVETGFVLFEVSDDSDNSAQKEENPSEIKDEKKEENAETSTRTIRYHLGPDFLDLKNLGSSLTFTVGNKPVKDFLMIERHYYNDILIKSFEFKFDFCIPNSTNTWESIYNMPELEKKLKEEIIANPWKTRSDSFYFVEGKLIMHNKAIYNYGPLS